MLDLLALADLAEFYRTDDRDRQWEILHFHIERKMEVGRGDVPYGLFFSMNSVCQGLPDYNNL